MSHGAITCPQCGAPLPPVGSGVAVLCPYCRAPVREGAEAAPRQLLMVDRGDRDEAAALLAQHLAAICEVPCAVRGGGERRLVPVWSVVTADGDHLCGPATRAEPGLLAHLALPALPARPLAPDEPLPDLALPADRPLAELASRAAGPPYERAWLVWVPVRFWDVTVGPDRRRALTVADAGRPLLGGAAPSAAARRAAAALDRDLLWPPAALAGGLILLGRLLPWPLHAAVGALLCGLFLWLWRPRSRLAGAAHPHAGGPA